MINSNHLARVRADVLSKGDFNSTQLHADDWPGEWQQDWAIAWDMVTVDLGTHPLLQFWQSFAAKLSGVTLAGNVAFQDDMHIAFELLNEPSDQYDIWYNQAPLTYSTINFPAGTLGSARLTKVKDAVTNWRALQMGAINKIRLSLPDQYVIASPFRTWGNMLDGSARLAADPNWSVPAWIPYNSEEVSGSSHIAYNIHFYFPYRYTESPWPTPSAVFPKYRRGVDWNTYNVGDDTNPTVGPPGPPNGHPNDRSMLPELQRILSWRAQYPQYPFIVSEFGAKLNGAAEYGNEQSGFDDPDVIDDKQMRAQWHFDVRKLMDQHGINWSMYEYIATMGAFQGSVEQNSRPYTNGTANVSGYSTRRTDFPQDPTLSGKRAMQLYISQALFGATSP